jgi:hypothetical protein
MKPITNKLINITALIKKHLSFDANQNVAQQSTIYGMPCVKGQSWVLDLC